MIRKTLTSTLLASGMALGMVGAANADMNLGGDTQDGCHNETSITGPHYTSPLDRDGDVFIRLTEVCTDGSRSEITMTHPVRRSITTPVCKSEDGSLLIRGKVRYQELCVWDARQLGNHKGRSFLLIQGPNGEGGRYIPITHRRAYSLTH